ncbi:hypothetical protein BJX96DRAFT_143780 [Aspergillus floccosus]
MDAPFQLKKPDRFLCLLETVHYLVTMAVEGWVLLYNLRCSVLGMIYPIRFTGSRYNDTITPSPSFRVGRW